MGWIAFIIIGSLAGWLAGKIMRGRGFGFITNLVVGILGAVLGGWLFKLTGVATSQGFMGSLIVSLVGAIVFLWLISMFKK